MVYGEFVAVPFGQFFCLDHPLFTSTGDCVSGFVRK
jgi:hypothetical protein